MSSSEFPAVRLLIELKVVKIDVAVGVIGRVFSRLFGDCRLEFRTQASSPMAPYMPPL